MREEVKQIRMKRRSQGRTLRLPSVQGGSGFLATSWRCRDGLRVEVSGGILPHWKADALYKFFANRWLLTIAEDFQQAQSPRIKGDVFAEEYAGRVKGVVVKALKAAGCSVALFLPVDIVVNKDNQWFGLVLTREGDLPSSVVSEIHRKVKTEFNVTLHFEKLAAMRRVRHAVAGLRKAGLVFPLSPDSTHKLRGHTRFMSAGLPVLGLEHLPTICIDAVGTKCHEDAVTGWRNPNGEIERWVFFPDRSYTDRFYPKTATPTFGIGWIEREGEPPQMKPLVSALVKAHRIVDEVDVAKTLKGETDLPDRFVRMMAVLRESVANNMGRTLGENEVGSAIVMNSILTAGHLLAKEMVSAGAPLIVRPHYNRAPVMELLASLGVSIHPWELRHDGILGFKLMLAAAQRSIQFDELISPLTGGQFRIAQGEVLPKEIAKLKGDRIDGRLNQSEVRRLIYGVDGESIEVMRQACDLLNRGLAKRSSTLKGVMRSPEARSLVDIYASGRPLSGTVQQIDVANEEILVNVDKLGPAILPAFYLQGSLGGAELGLQFLPAGWDMDRRLPFVTVVTS